MFTEMLKTTMVGIQTLLMLTTSNQSNCVTA